jgi:predicted GNAT family acetyltransferase
MAESDVVVHEPEKSRYVLKRGDEIIGVSNYEMGTRGEVVITHTEIDEKLQEKGLGSILARGMLDDLRTSTHAKVVAKCPFTFRFIATHPEYKDLTDR